MFFFLLQREASVPSVDDRRQKRAPSFYCRKLLAASEGLRGRFLADHMSPELDSHWQSSRRSKGSTRLADAANNKPETKSKLCKEEELVAMAGPHQNCVKDAR